MRIFYDTEFIEPTWKSPLYTISIGMVREDGETFYAQNRDCPIHEANAWVKQNVLPLLDEYSWMPQADIVAAIKGFVRGSKWDKPEFWGYFASHDHMALCGLVGGFELWPSEWPFLTYDVMQLAMHLGKTRRHFPAQTTTEHHALNDALWTKEVWEALTRRAD
jgi:hypothetical protein